MVLVKFNSNYADEFNCEGFHLYDNAEQFRKCLLISWLTYHGDEWNESKFLKYTIEELEDMVKPYLDYSMEKSFGSNEEFCFDDFADYKNSFSCQEISDEEAAIIKKYFDVEYGLYPYGLDF